MIKRDLYYERISTKSLRDDVRYLGTILGKVIKEQEGLKFFKLVEKTRLLSKANIANKSKKNPFKNLSLEIKKQSPKNLLKLTRAYNHFMNLYNLAESVDASRTLDQYENSSKNKKNKNLFIEEVFENFFRNKNITNNKIYDLAKKLNIGIVLTAHPTEVKRRTLIQKYHTLTEILEQRNLLKKYPSKIKVLDKRMFDELTIIWNTDELKRYKPSPFDEARWGLAIIEDSLWATIPKVYRRLNEIFVKNMKKNLPKDFNPIEFGSWMGGDRDGNPFVTSEVTKEVLLLSRWEAAKLYEKSLTKLIRSFSMQKCSKKILKYTGNSYEPYRVYLRPLRDKMRKTHRMIEQHLVQKKPLNENELISSRETILKPLRTVRESLEQTQNKNIANGELLDLIRRAKCFGINLARLDIRQESSRHTKLIAELVKRKFSKNYNSWTEFEKINFLASKIKQKNFINNFQFKDRENLEVWSTFKALANQPKECLGAYIISMTSSASDILSVILLQKEANIKHKLRVVPLFETLDDLERSAATVEALFSLSAYKHHINGKQEVMVGYSDSAKDAGRLAASWAQYKCQEEMVKIGKEHDVDLTFFHGKGGTVGRGGNPALYRAILAHPPNTINGHFRVTEQGEMITQNFGQTGVAERTLDLFTAGVLAEKFEFRPEPKQEWREAMERLADVSCDHYREIVRKHPRFVPYFRTSTPELELSGLNVGSRPAKRNPKGGVESLRAIPWVFAWTQTRLNLPAWLGVGEALNKVMQEKQLLCSVKRTLKF